MDALPRAAFKGLRTCRHCGWKMSGDRMKNHMAATRKFGDGTISCPGSRHTENKAKGIVDPRIKKKEQWKARKAAELAAALREIE